MTLTMVSILTFLNNRVLVSHIEQFPLYVSFFLGILGNSHEIFGTPLLKQAYDFIKSSGRKGVSGAEMGAYFGLGRLNSRTLIRNLERSKSIASYSCNEGRQKLQRYHIKHEISSSFTYLLFNSL